MAQYAASRKLSKSKKTMSQHFQFETNLSLTGSNADYRQPIKPSQEGLFVAELYNRIASSKLATSAIKNDVLDKAAAALLNSKGKSLVVSGSNDVNVQILINEINSALGNYGTTISLATPSLRKQGNDEAMNSFINDVVAGKISAVIFYGANPVFDHPRGAELAKALTSLKLSVSFADRADETASLVQFVAPDHHYLEAWSDAEPRAGFYSLGQPTISPIFKTRAAQESLLSWSGNNADYYTYLKSSWSTILGGASWDRALQDGVFETTVVGTESTTSAYFDHASVEAGINKNYTINTSGVELKLYEKIGLGTGSQANNPWLQELPDPISKATWDNYVAVSQKFADDFKPAALKQGDMVTVKSASYSVDLPVLIQPGQAGNTISIAIGYGRTKTGKCGDNVGKNVYPFSRFADGSVLDFITGVSITALGGDTYPIAQTQTHQTLMARPIIQDATLAEYIKDPSAGRFKPMVSTPDGKKAPALVDIWKDQHHQPNHLWSMSIDLNSCVGCGACVIACQAENNVPVVGKREVMNSREMHWIRIDRYYSSDAEPTETGEYFTSNKEGIGYDTLEIPSENPQVTFQPMMCQHCNHAPCETVCPVAATTHSSEGLNQMTYNRCIGTRYCANNCPYKVRRFNWFKYFDNEEKFDKNVAMNTSLGRMVLNPDVTVRSRGVMEKCSFCVQKIQEGKLKAKKEKRHIIDGEVTTACASACAAGAILFGDLRDLEGKVYQERHVNNEERTYTVLEELNVQPNVTYLTKIRNISKA